MFVFKPQFDLLAETKLSSGPNNEAMPPFSHIADTGWIVDPEAVAADATLGEHYEPIGEKQPRLSGRAIAIARVLLKAATVDESLRRASSDLRCHLGAEPQNIAHRQIVSRNRAAAYRPFAGVACIKHSSGAPVTLLEIEVVLDRADLRTGVETSEGLILFVLRMGRGRSEECEKADCESSGDG